MKGVHVICEKEISRLKELQPGLWNEIQGHFNGLVGLDVCFLDDYLEVPDGVSLYETCLEKFGQEVADVLKKLCTTSADLSE